MGYYHQRQVRKQLHAYMHGEIITSLLSFNILCIYCYAVECSVSILPVGICDIEILCYDNHPLKYHDYCKYHDIYLIGYNSAVKTKSHACSINIYHMSRNVDVFRLYAMQFVYDIDNNIMIMVAISV